MEPKRRSYGFYALQAFVIFGALHALWGTPLLSLWLTHPAGWRGFILGVVEEGIAGAVLVCAVAWIYYNLIAPQKR